MVKRRKQRSVGNEALSSDPLLQELKVGDSLGKEVSVGNEALSSDSLAHLDSNGTMSALEISDSLEKEV